MSEEEENSDIKRSRRFREQFRNVIQNISSVIIPLMLVNIEPGRIFMSIIPSIFTILFLVYDYYEHRKRNKEIDTNDKYVVLVKDKEDLEDYEVNQLYKDIEFYINKKIMDKGMKNSLVDQDTRLKYLGNNYYDYIYNLKLPEREFIKFDFEGIEMTIYKEIMQSSNSGNTHVKGLKIMADDFKIINKFLKECQKSFKEYIDNLDKVSYHFYRYDDKAKKWISKELKTVKNYDNVILPLKLETQIKNWLQVFHQSKDKYHKKGVPYKMGLLLYGVPGCGKTSLTYAIANETGRNIYQVPLSNTINCEDLKHIIETIPEGNIVLFEEVDTCAFFKKREFFNEKDASELYKQIKSKKKKEHDFEEVDDEDINDDETNEETNEETDGDSSDSEDKNQKKESDDMEKIKIELKKFNPSHNTKTDMNVGKDDSLFTTYIQSQTFHLLEILDGYNYLHDNIVVMYTNHVDRIDSAIIRPGRIDHKIMLTYADAYQVRKTYQLFYEVDIGQKLAETIASRQITTSFLINTCIIPCFFDMEQSIHLALNEEQ